MPSVLPGHQQLDLALQHQLAASLAPWLRALQANIAMSAMDSVVRWCVLGLCRSQPLEIDASDVVLALPALLHRVQHVTMGSFVQVAPAMPYCQRSPWKAAARTLLNWHQKTQKLCQPHHRLCWPKQRCFL